MNDEKILSTKEVSLLLRVSEATVCSMAKTGRLPANKIKGKYLFREDDIDRYRHSLVSAITVNYYFERWIKPETWYKLHPIDRDRFYSFLKVLNDFSKGRHWIDDLMVAIKYGREKYHPDDIGEYFEDIVHELRSEAETIICYLRSPLQNSNTLLDALERALPNVNDWRNGPLPAPPWI